MKEEEMRKTERENIKIQLHLSMSGKLSFDIHREMSPSAQPKQRQPATVYTCLTGPWSCSQQTEDELSATLSTLSRSRKEKRSLCLPTTVNTDKCHQTVHSHDE